MDVEVVSEGGRFSNRRRRRRGAVEYLKGVRFGERTDNKMERDKKE
jgi:hypothetical protein